jgi:hypothetical protein
MQLWRSLQTSYLFLHLLRDSLHLLRACHRKLIMSAIRRYWGKGNERSCPDLLATI